MSAATFCRTGAPSAYYVEADGRIVGMVRLVRTGARTPGAAHWLAMPYDPSAGTSYRTRDGHPLYLRARSRVAAGELLTQARAASLAADV